MRNKQKIQRWLNVNNSRLSCRLLSRHYEMVSYVIFGITATIVNMAIYTFLEGIIGQSNWFLSNFPAIIVAILFAYVTNRSFVFDSSGGFWFEMYKFVGARLIVAVIFEYGTIYLLFNVLHFSAKLDLVIFSISWFKIISLLLVLTANYIASKLFVFKNVMPGGDCDGGTSSEL